MTTKKQSIRSTAYLIQKGDSTEFVDGAVIEEVLACIFVNGQELAKFMCSPHNLDELALVATIGSFDYNLSRLKRL